MGEPAAPTPAERDATLDLARALVAAVTNDEAWPAPFTAGTSWLDAMNAVFRLAQDLVAANERIAELHRSFVRLTQEHPFPDELKGWTEQLRALLAEIGSLKAELAETQRRWGAR